MNKVLQEHFASDAYTFFPTGTASHDKPSISRKYVSSRSIDALLWMKKPLTIWPTEFELGELTVGVVLRDLPVIQCAPLY